MLLMKYMHVVGVKINIVGLSIAHSLPLRVIPPLSACFLSLSTVLYIKGKKSQKKYT